MTVFRFLMITLFSCYSYVHAENYPKKFEGSFEKWEQKQLDLISFFLPDAPVILQAGGHYGGETVQLATYFPSSPIFSFEPNPHAFEILCANTINYPNIKTYPYALNEYIGRAPFYICHGSLGTDAAFEHASSLLKPSECMEIHYQGPCVDVDCVELDDWCRRNDIDHIDLMCLDLQGAELQVLKSSPEILNQVKCLSIHTHFFPFRIGTTTYTELRAFLEESGFQLLSHWYREGLDGRAIFVKKDFFFNTDIEEYLKHDSIDDRYKRYYEPFFNVYYDLDDRTDSLKDILKQGYAYEGNIGILIDQLTKPGSLTIDIGSHVGVHTIIMSRKVGPQGGVIAFEPNKQLYMELLHTLKLNDCTNVIPIAKALSDTPEILQISAIEIVQDENPDEESYPIDAITLDSLNFENVSLIKMDVEKFEYFVLKGAKETILRNQPVILFECWIGPDYENSDPKEKANFDRVISLIESYEYEVYVIYNNDFIAFPKDVNSEFSEYKKNFRKLDLNAFDLGL